LALELLMWQFLLVLEREQAVTVSALELPVCLLTC
jgi:hypothetical protein